jgi:hypothetical protein
MIFFIILKYKESSLKQLHIETYLNNFLIKFIFNCYNTK